jgi:hypothetical protein
MTGAIAAAALFVVMASSHYVITRQSRSASVVGRMDELEEALVVLDGDLQRIDQVEDVVARLDLLTDRVERLDQAMSVYTGVEPSGGVRAPTVDRLTQDVEQRRGRLDALRSDFAEEARTQRIEIGAELKSLEGLIHTLSRELAAASGFAASAAEESAARANRRAARRAAGASIWPLSTMSRKGREVIDLLADETVVVTEEAVVIVTDTPVAEEPYCRGAGQCGCRALHCRRRACACRRASRSAETMLQDLRDAIEANRSTSICSR